MAPLRQALLSSASSASSFSRTLERVVTHLASGNLLLTYHGDGIHESEDCATDEVESFILQVLQNDFGYKDIPVMVRTVDELRQALQDNPLPGKHKGNGPYFAWLNQIPDECYIDDMEKIDYSPETYVIHKGLRLIYFSYYQKCKLDTTIFENEVASGRDESKSSYNPPSSENGNGSRGRRESHKRRRRRPEGAEKEVESPSSSNFSFFA